MVQIGRKDYNISDEFADKLSDLMQDLGFEETKAVRAAINLRMDRIAAENRDKFPVGSRASFIHTKRGDYITGEITKHNSQNTKLRTDAGMTWTVSREMLIEPPEDDSDGEQE